MASAQDLRRIALALPGTREAPHFDRTSFRVERVYATMPGDGLTANVKLSREEQEFRCLLNPDALLPVPNAWGRQGWTTLTLGKLNEDELGALLEAAWQGAQPKPRTRR